MDTSKVPLQGAVIPEWAKDCWFPARASLSAIEALRDGKLKSIEVMYVPYIPALMSTSAAARFAARESAKLCRDGVSLRGVAQWRWVTIE
jgi:hypothetical protein